MKKIYFILFNTFLISHFLFGQDHIHWGSTGDPNNGLTITWHSMGTSDQIKWGYLTSYEQGTFPGTRRNDYSGYLYDYTFTTVSYSSIIHYSIFSNGSWTPDKTFQTAVDPATTQFSFIAGGDSRTILDDWETAANKLASETVDFNLFLGDHVNTGTYSTEWDNWYSRGAIFLEKNLIYHTSGNHEYGSIYLNQFVLPGNKEWYSFEFGDVLFICLLSEKDFSTQQAWLVNELSATTKNWKVVFFHKPFFTIGGHANEMNTHLGTWWKAFDDYGAPLISTGSDWFIEKNVSMMNYTKFVLIDNILNMKAYNLSGIIIDSVTINKQITTEITDSGTNPPFGFTLNQNYPNPFNIVTTITYNLTSPNNITLKILDPTGREIETLVQGFQPAGDHQIYWQPKELQSGIYFYRLEVGNASAGSVQNHSETKKLIFIK